MPERVSRVTWGAAIALLLPISSVPAGIDATSAAALGPFTALRSKLVEMTERGDAVSVAIAVRRGGRVLWAEGFGWADREGKVRATPDTLYPIGSVSKSITATGLMVLVERARVGLDDPVLPLLGAVRLRDGGGRAADLKVRHLLDMTGGIPHLWSYTVSDGTAGRDGSGEILRRYGFIAFPPGALFSYSNLSYGVLDRVIGSAAGEDYAHFMRREVFAPLGMAQTSVGRSNETAAREAAAYDEQGRRTPSYRFEPRAAAGIHSSARELLGYAGLHLKLPAGHRAILTEASIDLLHTPSIPSGKLGSWYMAGWGVLRMSDGATVLLTNGAILGAAASILLVPGEGVAVVCLTNSTRGEGFTDGLAFEAADALLPGLKPRLEASIAEGSARYEPAPYRPDPRFLGTWQGVIESAEGSTSTSWTFDPDGRIVVRGRDGLESVVDDARVADGTLTGRVRGSLPLPEIAARPHHLEFELREQANTLVGFVRAVAGHPGPGFGLPAFVRLTRKPGRATLHPQPINERRACPPSGPRNGCLQAAA